MAGTGGGGGGSGGGGGEGGGGGGGRRGEADGAKRKQTISERWETAEEHEARERRALREQLRQRGIRVPPELIEPEARHPVLGHHRGRREESVGPRREGQGQRSRADGEKKLLRTWRCEGPACSHWNWPCRKRCHRCGTDRPPSPQRRDDWWLAAMLPPWASDEAKVLPRGVDGADQSVAGKRDSGLAQATDAARGAGPRASAVLSRGGGDGGSRRSQQQQQQQRQHQQQQQAPGGREPPPPHHERDQMAADDVGDGGETWSMVVGRKGRRIAAAKKDGPAARAASAGDTAAGQEEDKQASASLSAPLPRDLPPIRLLDLPVLPRQTLVRRHQAAAEKVEKMQEQGVKPARLQKAVEAKARLEQSVRAAGGHTAQALSFSIKGEDDKIEKAERALQKAKQEKAERVELIAYQTAQLEEDDVLIARLDQRLQAARTRREHLSRQKWAESVSDDTVNHIRAVAAGLTPGDPAHGLVKQLLELMAPLSEVDLAVDDTESEEGQREEVSGLGGEGRGRVDSDVTMPEGDMQSDIDTRLAEDEAALAQAEEAYAALRAQRQAAIDAAEGAGGLKCKRALGADGPKGQDAQDDHEMVRPLTVAQATALFDARIAHCEQEIEYRWKRVQEHREAGVRADRPGVGAAARRGRSSEPAARRERRRAGTVGSSQDEASRSGSACTARRTRSTAGGPANGRCGSEGMRRSDAAPQRRSASGAGRRSCDAVCGRGLEGLQGVCSPAELQRRVRDGRIQEQERLQAQQEDELEEVRRGAIRALRVRQAASEIDLRLRPPQPALPTYGPTGHSLQLQQQLMQQAHRLQAQVEQREGDVGMETVEPAGPRRRTRWQAEQLEDVSGSARSSSRSPRPAAR